MQSIHTFSPIIEAKILLCHHFMLLDCSFQGIHVQELHPDLYLTICSAGHNCIVVGVGEEACLKYVVVVTTSVREDLAPCRSLKKCFAYDCQAALQIEMHMGL